MGNFHVILCLYIHYLTPFKFGVHSGASPKWAKMNSDKD